MADIEIFDKSTTALGNGDVGALASALDVSGLTGNWTVYLDVYEATDDWLLEVESEAAASFSTPVTIKSIGGGAVSDGSKKSFSFRDDSPGMYTANFGVTNGKLRFNLKVLASGQTMKARAWMRYNGGEVSTV